MFFFSGIVYEMQPLFQYLLYFNLFLALSILISIFKLHNLVKAIKYIKIENVSLKSKFDTLKLKNKKSTIVNITYINIENDGIKITLFEFCVIKRNCIISKPTIESK